ncbi:MAG TPA: BON domain-containing protein [Steroidobacteraceae bacterium]|nr:BON domain-containing protein [Steroidobacteraceae bacterium]
MLQRRLVLAAMCGLVVHGVAYADSQTDVQSSDTEINDRVVHELMKADADVARRIDISTLNGVVTLEGTVFTPAQVLKIAADAGRVRGVVQVRNRLRVRM